MLCIFRCYMGPVVCTGRCRERGRGKHNCRSYKNVPSCGLIEPIRPCLSLFLPSQLLRSAWRRPFCFQHCPTDFRCTPLLVWYVQMREDMRVTDSLFCFFICFKGPNVKKKTYDSLDQHLQFTWFCVS